MAQAAILRDAAKRPLLRMRVVWGAERGHGPLLHHRGGLPEQQLALLGTLLVRSAAKRRVSNHGASGHPSRRGQEAAPQDEGGVGCGTRTRAATSPPRRSARTAACAPWHPPGEERREAARLEPWRKRPSFETRPRGRSSG